MTGEATASRRFRRLVVLLSAAMLVGLAIGWSAVALIVDDRGDDDRRPLASEVAGTTGAPRGTRPAAGATLPVVDGSVVPRTEPPSSDPSIVTAPTTEPARRGPDREADRRSLAEHRALWEAKRPARYQYNLQTGCFCALDEYVVTVRNGSVASAVPASSATRGAATALTLDQVFDRAAEAIETSGYYAVVYDDTWGFPLTISTVVEGQAQEGQMTYATSLFRVVS